MCALIIGLITLLGITRLNLIPTSVKILTFTPAAIALIQRPSGKKVKKIDSTISTTTTIIPVKTNSGIILPPYFIYIFLTTIRIPSTRTITISLPFSMKSPSVTTSNFSSPNTATPAGRKSVYAFNFFPTNSTLLLLAT